MSMEKQRMWRTGYEGTQHKEDDKNYIVLYRRMAPPRKIQGYTSSMSPEFKMPTTVRISNTIYWYPDGKTAYI